MSRSVKATSRCLQLYLRQSESVTRGVIWPLHDLSSSSEPTRHLHGQVTSAISDAADSHRPSSSMWAQQRRGMFIQTHPTPNPNSLMFVPGKQVMEQGSKDFASAREAMASPLAIALFRIDGVAGVFFGSDFVTVKKTDEMQWELLKPEIYAAIMDHFSSNKPLFTEESAGASDTAINEDDSEVIQMIKELLETRIKPAVAEDGGDVLFVSFDEVSGRVILKMQGACSGCPSSSVTLKSGIEQMMRHYIPEVTEVVEADPDEGESESLAAFNRLEQHLSA